MSQVISVKELEDKKRHIEEDLKTNRVILYMKGSKNFPSCRFSGEVVSILKDLNVDFEVRDVLPDPVLRQAIKEFSEWPTLPQLYIDKEFIGGCDIILELHEKGELFNLLDGNFLD